MKLLNRKNIVGTLKYTNYEKEIKRSFKKKSFNFENWKYDAEQKEYICPCGNPVPYKKTVTKKNSPSYPQSIKSTSATTARAAYFVNCALSRNTAGMVQKKRTLA